MKAGGHTVTLSATPTIKYYKSHVQSKCNDKELTESCTYPNWRFTSNHSGTTSSSKYSKNGFLTKNTGQQKAVRGLDSF